MQIFRRSWRLRLRGPTAQHEVAWHRPPAGPGAPHTAQRHHFLYTLAISYLREPTKKILIFLYSVFIENLHSYMRHSTFIICTDISIYLYLRIYISICDSWHVALHNKSNQNFVPCTCTMRSLQPHTSAQIRIRPEVHCVFVAFPCIFSMFEQRQNCAQKSLYTLLLST